MLNSIKPSWYQIECLKKVGKAREMGKKKSLVVMATGLGKTVTVAFDVKRWIMENPNKRVLYLCHQNDILRHAHTRFEAIIGGEDERYGFYHGESKKLDAQFLFASFQTMRDALHCFKPDDFGYIIVDESHHAQAETYIPVLEFFQPDFMLGITATPDRADKKDIRDIFGEEAYSLPLERALALGLLAQVDYRIVTDEIIELRKIRNPYRLSIEELNKRIFVPKRDKEIARIISEKITDLRDPKIIIFCSSIRHAEILQKVMPGSMVVHSGISLREQHERIQAFRDGIINAILTVDKFNEGIDIPEVNVVVFLRSTQSETIFYQQLGRGLRKTKSKAKVLVLDFVANCERIEIVHDLVEKINREFEQEKNEFSLEERKHLTVDFGDFNFTERARDILDILNKVRGGYTKEALIEQLQSLGQKLQKAPTTRDVEKASMEGHIGSVPLFLKLFGGFNKALEEAGFEINLRRHTKSELIEQLKVEAVRLKRSPTSRDMDKASQKYGTACADTIARSFGGFNKALEAANLAIHSRKNPTKEELIKQLQEEFKNIPLKRDVDMASKEGRIFSVAVFVRIFGSFNKALEAAGFFPRHLKKTYTKNDLIKQIQREKKRLKRVPNTQDMSEASKKQRSASIGVFFRVFGSFSKALEAAGLSAEGHAFKSDMLKQLKLEAKRLKRTPTTRDIDRASQKKRTVSAYVLAKTFGSFNDALELAGFKKNYTKEEIIKQLQKEADRLKKTPTYRDINRAASKFGIAKANVAEKLFGSWNKALEAAGLKRGGKK